jgi:hypothetical protein
MHKITSLLVSLAFIASPMVFSQQIQHNLYVSLSLQDNAIEVTDSMSIPVDPAVEKADLSFKLNRNLEPESLDRSYKISAVEDTMKGTLYKTYIITYKNDGSGTLKVPLKYTGKISDAVTTGADEYARGFSETSGIISDSGVYLSGGTYWIPTLDTLLLTYDLTVRLPGNWNVVSQGKRIVNTVNGDERTVKYRVNRPAEEVYLVAAAWTEYEKTAGQVLVQAFLRTPDPDLASRYLDATAGYLDMYVELIGPYPYSKFALVENFWETGYGMPSFTLLGEKIIRFPWILSTSYPHELLHNWWGNSVYVDFEKGNWCEGLTAYMADHLLKEQAGKGAEYRRTTLQKFTDYVNAENDMPLLAFRSRNNPAEEAIGYGKSLMFNHMLRKHVGDSIYVMAYRKFYRNNIYRISTFDDIRLSFQAFTEEDLKPFFDQWLKRKGAPTIMLEDVGVLKREGKYGLRFDLVQQQEEDPFDVMVPVHVYLEDTLYQFELASYKRTNPHVLTFDTRPVRVEVDPGFDVFRRLDKREVPPSLSQLFGSRSALIILPQNSPLLEEYTALAESWKQVQQAQGKSLEIMMDEEVDKLPASTNYWVLGFENKYAPDVDVHKDYATAFSGNDADQFNTIAAEGSVVYAIPNPLRNSYTVGFIGTNIKEAVPGLTRLLPHYGKYSYLGFEGERPNNVLKGEFPAINSPMLYTIPYDGEYLQTTATVEPAKALIE